MAEKTFYDIHMHAFNLSHPYLLAFLQRLNIHRILVLNSLLGPLASLLVGKNYNKVKNLLAVMENDMGSFFLMTEDYLQREDKNPVMTDGKLHIGGKVYSRIILTPLMIDFGYKDIIDDPDTYYNELSQKPVVEQVIDVFRGIKKYKNTSASRVFEIYPFLGLNTRNYDMNHIRKMLDKYFGSYGGSREKLQQNMGKFDGNIEHLDSNCFAGIKIYPPLGFDPWPEKPEELEKVRYVYDYCSRKGIPITVHGSESGFVALPKSELIKCTAISKWRRVLNRYPTLKINLAHFPVGEKYLWLIPKKRRLKEILSLVWDYDNVYVDFSCRAVNDRYYVLLKRLMQSLPVELKEKLKSRVLFGSDFTINLMSVRSYNGYLDVFSRNNSFDDKEKEQFCSINPERFLFSETD